MNRVKASGFEFLRKKMAEAGPEQEKQFLAQLPPDEVVMYQTALPVSWVDIEGLSHAFTVAAGMLYPGHPRPLLEFGREEAKHALSGIYKVLLRFATVPYVVQKTALLWRVYYEKGQAVPEASPEQKQASLIVKNYPDLLESNLTITTGYTLGLLEMTGLSGLRYEENFHNPEAWKWTFFWGDRK